MASLALSYVDLSRDLLVNLVCETTLNMSRELIEKGIEATAILIADGKEFPLLDLLVGFRSNTESFLMSAVPGNPVPASAKTLTLLIAGLDTQFRFNVRKF